MRLLKLVAVLLVLTLAALAGYAYFGDMGSDPREMRMPVELDLGAEQPATAPTETPAEPERVEAAAPDPDGATGQDDRD
ncbi:hypothetical protein SAMN04487972_10453 [Paracoccus halophilus]|uniref:Uncharacterized protein n=1 Tax=Paracoccus halophilus TaxID=376733 RepID=A0A099F7J0_9RHOB|nr:hypothetical protein [Paracoccus halophilus]KGJ06236.1 hypothetical protein IT41_03495 [Paracoccus halophilus]SFA45572.1 hypothetical protein SAMN04487972_10453 [Paracoccus halophilus]